ncbi:hypothetical protein [Haloarcula salinisoli]|uniref:Uncharacterized protein n=1 Tax=Haloarcula salinisoli TaxID=2487746 RepID=A0A8J7YIP7_9EURY|nr:hypothetical protein [Halomicroarcula salinisoli]MBX0303424.1 hypothetical protein [Halomicroarcula salinisoli]
MGSDEDETPANPPVQFYGISLRTLILAAIALYLGSLARFALVTLVPGPFEVCHGRPPGHCHLTWFGSVSHQH